MSNSVQRFIKRKKTLQMAKDRHGLSLVVDKSLIDGFMAPKVDFQAIKQIEENFDKKYEFEVNTDVPDHEVKELLGIIETEYDDQKFNNLLSACKNDVLSALVGPFGLGSLVAMGDKNGGNVDTINNAREGVYATDKEKQLYESRGDYDSSKYHGHKDYIGTNRQDSEQQKNGTLNDAYTDNKISSRDKRDLDHTISSKEIHDDPGRVLAEKNGADAANTQTNLNSTERTINRAKGSKTTEEFIEYLERTKPERKNKIQELSNKSNLTVKEQKELKKLKALDSVDENKIREKDEQARKSYNSDLNKEYYLSKKFAINVAKTGVKEGAKMGLQQAMGLVFCEFFQATFDEAKDVYHHGFKAGSENDSFFHVLKKRFLRIASRIATRWKDVFKAFGAGFISGFLSNLVTVVINMFVRTGKRMVRIIREGFFSLLKAVKMLCFPPKGMTFAQAAHESSKLIATGLMVVGGIALEQHIDNLIKASPMIEPFADIITTVIVGALTGLATTFIVYGIDKLDLFKVNDKEKHEYVMGKMEANLNNLFKKGEFLVEELSFSYV